jgi:tRNA threonylcarbamoyladenosine biosynthesis protein TsaB
VLPAAEGLLSENKISHSDLAGYAVASGPGSFTGVRVGLTTVKAWSEVYGKPIFAISRLRILSDAAPENADFVAVFIDAGRSQVFAALYRKSAEGWQNVIQESVISPLDFFGSCLSAAADSRLAWVSLDTRVLTDSPLWGALKLNAREIVQVHSPLAAKLGKLALRQSEAQQVDALTLDANYIRRSDAEIFGNKVAGS